MGAKTAMSNAEFRTTDRTNWRHPRVVVGSAFTKTQGIVSIAR
jgi:hypothetical protein